MSKEHIIDTEPLEENEITKFLSNLKHITKTISDFSRDSEILITFPLCWSLRANKEAINTAKTLDIPTTGEYINFIAPTPESLEIILVQFYHVANRMDFIEEIENFGPSISFPAHKSDSDALILIENIEYISKQLIRSGGKVDFDISFPIAWRIPTSMENKEFAFRSGFGITKGGIFLEAWNIEGVDEVLPHFYSLMDEISSFRDFIKPPSPLKKLLNYIKRN